MKYKVNYLCLPNNSSGEELPSLVKAEHFKPDPEG